MGSGVEQKSKEEGAHPALHRVTLLVVLDADRRARHAALARGGEPVGDVGRIRPGLAAVGAPRLHVAAEAAQRRVVHRVVVEQDGPVSGVVVHDRGVGVGVRLALAQRHRPNLTPLAAFLFAVQHDVVVAVVATVAHPLLGKCEQVAARSLDDARNPVARGVRHAGREYRLDRDLVRALGQQALELSVPRAVAVTRLVRSLILVQR